MYLLTSLSVTLSLSLAVCYLLLSIRIENNGKNYPGIGSLHTTQNKRELHTWLEKHVSALREIIGYNRIREI